MKSITKDDYEQKRAAIHELHQQLGGDTLVSASLLGWDEETGIVKVSLANALKGIQGRAHEVIRTDGSVSRFYGCFFSWPI